jgi:methylthioribose-1-phosphate isomerase
MISPKDPELPLLARPAWIEGDKIKLLDESKLPQVNFIYLFNYEEAAKAIKDMKTRALGQFYVVLESMRLTAIKNRHLDSQELLRELDKARNMLGSARPTANLRRVADKIYEYALRAKEENLDIAKFIDERVELWIKRMKENMLKWAEVATSLIEDGDTILTHCNMSGMMVLLARACKRRGKNIGFIVTETRPYLQGARETAWELSDEGFDVTIIPDSAAGYVLWKGMADIVIVGSDRCAMNGDIANKVGTYLIALAAFENNVPFYVAGWPDPSTKRGEEIPIEERSGEEVLYFEGKRIAPEKAKGYYPAFDVVPAKYISGIITHLGVFPPTAIAKVLERLKEDKNNDDFVYLF